MRTNIDKLRSFILNKNERQKILDNSSQEDIEFYNKSIDFINLDSLTHKPNHDKIKGNILNDIRKNRGGEKSIFNVLRYAAAIVAIGIVSAVSYYIYSDIGYNDKLEISEIIKSESPKEVQLLLSDGKTISLSDKLDQTIIKDKEVNVLVDSNKVLRYEKRTDSLTKISYNTIIVPRGAEYSIRLSDNTVVRLNSDSKLRYPIRFTDKVRKVYLEGEGYFKVTTNKKSPFIVNVDEMDVRVLGTTFNVNAYKDDGTIKTTLVEGKVQVNSNGKSVVLNPSQQAILNKDKLTKKDVNPQNYISWIEGVFRYDDMNLDMVMRKIERWYDVNVFFVSEDLKGLKFNGAIMKDCSVERVVKAIEEVCQINIRVKNKNLYIEKI